MSLPDFQRAFGIVLGDPQSWAACLARPGARVGDLELSDAERERLRRILLHPGMAANCVQLRANRWMPIQGALPLTCDWLRGELSTVLDAWLEDSEEASVQYEREAARFADWLPTFLARKGRLPHPALDALRYEQALAELVRLASTSPGEAGVELAFDHDPERLLLGWSPGLPPLDTPIRARLGILDGMIVLEAGGRDATGVR
jgi:hypothetical protein